MSLHLEIRDLLPLASLRGTPEENLPLKDEHDIYNPYKSPADFDLAEKHGQAKQIYASKPNDIPLDNDLCPCCGLPLEGTRIPITCDLSAIYHLGSGYALYFQFVKHCIVLLFLMFGVSGIYNLYTNYTSGDCGGDSTENESQYCHEDFITVLTIANKRNHYDRLTVQLVLNLITIIVIAIYFHYIRYETRKTIIAADDETMTPSDYTLQLKGIPKEVGTEKEVAEWLESQASSNHPIKVVKVLRTFEISEYVRDLRLKQELVEKKRSLDVKEEKLQKIEQELTQVNKRLENVKRRGLEHTDIAFAVFVQAAQANYLAKKFERKWYEKLLELVKVIDSAKDYFKGSRILVRRAPEPTDILWENLGSSILEKFAKRIAIGLIMLLLVAGGFIFIVLISWGQILILKDSGEGSVWLTILGVLILIVIVAMDPIIGIIVGRLVSHQKFSTCTAYYTSVAQLLSISQFLNTALTTLLAKLFVSMQLNPQHSLIGDIQATNFYGSGGLIQTTFYVFITNSFINPITTIFDPPYSLKRILIKKALKQGKNNNLTQQEAQEMFERQDFSIDWRYGYIVETMLYVSFYAPAMPIALVLTLIGLIISYWTEKYVFLTRCVLPNSLSSQLQENMIELLEWMGFTYTIGNLIFYINLEDLNGGKVIDSVPFLIIVLSIIVSLVHIFFPMQFVNEKLFPLVDEVTEFEDYSQARLTFMSDYDIANPITSRKAIKELVGAYTQGKDTEDQQDQTQNRDQSVGLVRAQSQVPGHNRVQSQAPGHNRGLSQSQGRSRYLSQNKKGRGPSREVLLTYYKQLLGKMGNTDEDNPFSHLDQYSKEMSKPQDIKKKARKVNFNGVAARINRNLAEGLGTMFAKMVGANMEDSRSHRPSDAHGVSTNQVKSHKDSGAQNNLGGFFLNMLKQESTVAEPEQKKKKMSNKDNDIEMPLLKKL